MDADDGTADTRAAFIGSRDSRGLVVHEYTTADWSEFPQDPQTIDTLYRTKF